MTPSKHQFAGKCKRVKLSDICVKGKSSLRQKDIANDGPYAVYGASGIVGSTSCFQNAKPYVAVVKDGAGVGRANACNAETSVLGTMQALIPKEGVDCRYLLHLVRSMRLGEDFSGSTIPHIYFRDYGKTLVPFPDMSGQRQIVEALDDIEKQRLTATKQIDRLDSLVKSRFIEMFGDPIDGTFWAKRKLSNLYEVKSSKRIYAREQTKDGVPFLRLADIGSLIDSGISDSGLFISEERFEELRSKGLVPNPGDVLVTARGTLGRCYIIKPSDCFYFQDGMITWLAAIESSPLPSYLLAVFNNPHFIEELNRNCSGTTVKYLSISDLANVAIPVPPLELQHEFETFVTQVDKSRFAGTFTGTINMKNYAISCSVHNNSGRIPNEALHSAREVTECALFELQELYDSLTQKYFAL